MTVNTETTASTSKSIKTHSDSFSRKASCKTYAVKPTKDLPADVIAMRTFAVKVNSRSIEDFKRIFKKIQRKGAFADKLTYDAQKQNATKCRYDNVICLDHNRVILKAMPPFSGDFIHANWISSEFLSRKLICAQGPMENTIVDFWRMIWQEHIELIIMLCKLVEDAKEKCAPYWPSKAGEKKDFSGFTITTAKWTSWPDRDAPRHLITPYTLHGISRTVQGPTVVHCSAGIGRTGTFVMLEIVYRCLRAGNITSVYSLLSQLRSQRAGSVQTFDQFLYIFYATIQRLINRGVVDSTTVTNFCTIYETRFKTKTGQIPIQWPIPKRRILIENRSHYRRHKQINEVQNRKGSEDVKNDNRQRRLLRAQQKAFLSTAIQSRYHQMENSGKQYPMSRPPLTVYPGRHQMLLMLSTLPLNQRWQ